jgi:YbgC/YbaW family acyl-CoA thioester hydrolase
MAQFVTQRRVRFSETDMAGIVHFANFYRWMEEAEHEYFRSLGLSIMQTQDDGTVLGWPRVSAGCTFSAPARYDQIIDVHLNVSRVGARSVTYAIEFHIEGRRIAFGQMKSACCLCAADGSLTSVDIPDHYRQLIQESPSQPVAS